MAMTVACLDGQQYPRQLSFGQMSCSNSRAGNGSGHLGKRKRPGSRSGLIADQVKVNGFSNQWSMSTVKGEEIASVRKISFTKPDASSLLPSPTASDLPAAAAGSTTTIHISPFRSTDNPSSPKSRCRRLASMKTTTYTSACATSTVMTMTARSLGEYGLEYKHELSHEVGDATLGLATSFTIENITPLSTRITHLSTEPVSQVSAAAVAALPASNSTFLPRTSKPPLSQSSSSSTVTSRESLKPCHICQSRPRQKSDLHKYVDCARCMRRVCCVCARECAGIECRARLVCSGCCMEDHGRRDVEVGDVSEREWAVNVFCWDCFGDG